MLNRALHLLKDCHADNNRDEAMHSSLQADINASGTQQPIKTIQYIQTTNSIQQ